jgi:hypothetical protein
VAAAAATEAAEAGLDGFLHDDLFDDLLRLEGNSLAGTRNARLYVCTHSEQAKKALKATYSALTDIFESLCNSSPLLPAPFFFARTTPVGFGSLP